MSDAANTINEPLGSFIFAIRKQKWNDALELLRANPELAKAELPILMEINMFFSRKPRKVDNHGPLPLHLACYNKDPHGLIEQLVRIHPQAAKVQDKRGRLPLHKLFELYAYEKYDEIDARAVVCLINSNPSAVGKRDGNGNLPLHYAAQNNSASTKAVLRLIAAHPEAAKVANDDGELPLHLACYHWACIHLGMHNDFREMTMALFEAYPEAVFAKDQWGRLPLDVLLKTTWRSIKNDKLIVFDRLLDANTGAAQTANKDGRLLLHEICIWHPWYQTDLHAEMYQAIIKANPSAAFVADKQGRLPLHLACKKWPASFGSTLAMLLASNPGAIHAVDDEGLTPLDCAMKRSEDSNEFVRGLFSLSFNEVLASQQEQRNYANQELAVSLAGAMERNKELEERKTSLENALIHDELIIESLTLYDGAN